MAPDDGSQSSETLARLLDPRGIAIVGASDNEARIGGQPVKALTEFGYAGKVYPVNPRYETIKGLTCYRDLLAVPQPCDIALIAVPGTAVPDAIRQCGQAGIPFAIVLSAGFEEIGAGGAELQRDLEQAIATSGVRIVGPNCQGLLSPLHKVYCGFGAPFLYPHSSTGPVALVTQSGGFGYAVMGQAEAAGLGFNHVVSTGNEADITALDLIDHLIDRDDTSVIATYLEGVEDGRRLIALGRRAARKGKPILVWKVGNSTSGRRAAASHTANLSAPYELYRAAFRQGAFIEVRDMDDLVDLASAFNARRLPRGNRIAVVSVSGGAGVLLADCCDEFGLALPEFTVATQAALSAALPSFSSARNPVDVTAQIFNDVDLFRRVLSTIVDDETVDQAIVVTASLQGALAARIAEQVTSIKTDKPILIAASATAQRMADALATYAAHGVPVYPTPRRAAKAAAALSEFVTKSERARRYSEPTRPAISVRAPQDLGLSDAAGTLGEHRSKQLVARYGIPVVAERLLSFAEIERLAEPPFSFPVVMKLESPDLPHKSEAGAVRVGINSLAEMKTAQAEMRVSALRFNPKARIDGVLVQELVSGTEIIAGAVDDPYFGPTVMVGLGGVHTEVLRDIVHGFAPFSPATAREMILSLRGARLLQGYRNTPPLDIDALADALSCLSWLAADTAGLVREIDINPIFVRPAGQGVVAADSLVTLHRA